MERPQLSEIRDKPVSTNGSIKGDPNVTPGSEKELAYNSATSKPKPVAPHGNSAIAVVSAIVGGWILAAAFAVAHQGLGMAMKGRVVPDDPVNKKIYEFYPNSQDSIKTGVNTLVRGVVLSLTVAAGGVLAQMIWRVPSRRAIPVDALDKLFKVPSLSAAGQLIISPVARFLVLILCLVFSINALELVNIFAPQTLKVVPAHNTTDSVNVASLDLSNGPVTSADIYSEGYIRPSAFWTRTVQKILLFPAEVGITAPEDCDAGCHYTIQYNAPALQCENIPDQQITIGNVATTSPSPLYVGTSSLWGSTADITSDTAPTVNALPAFSAANDTDSIANTNYTLEIQWQSFQYSSNDLVRQSAYRAGVTCQFYDGKYSASISFNGTNQNITTELVSVGVPLVGLMANQPSSCPSINSPQEPCWVDRANYRATAEAFTEMLVGAMSYSDDGRITVSGQPNMPSLFNATTIIDTSGSRFYFNLTVPDLGIALQNIFGNVTLGLISVRDDTARVDVEFLGSGNVWEFDSWFLWAIYGPTLLVFGIFAIHGLVCLKQDGPVEVTFSSLLLAAKGEDMDKIIENAEDRKEIKDVKLSLGSGGVFEVANRVDKILA